MKTSKEDILKRINAIRNDAKTYAEQLVNVQEYNQLWHDECIRQCSMAQQEILGWQFVLSVYDEVEE